MAVFKPFKAFRPTSSKAKDVAAYPYDVVNSEEARAIVDGNPDSFLRVGKPEVDLDPNISLYDAKVYAKGKENLSRLITDGILVEDATPCFYVVDGHHRSAAAAIVGKERREANPNHNGNENYNHFLAVLFPASELYIMDYNRLVVDLNGNSVSEFLDKVSEKFTIEKSDSKVSPSKKGEFGFYSEGNWYKLNIKPELVDLNDPVESLDVALLQKNVLDNLLGIEDPRTDERIDFVGGIRGLEELVRRVDNGEMKAAISMFPTSIEELMNIADAGRVMPPKSTWFEPKLRDGLFVHFLD